VKRENGPLVLHVDNETESEDFFKVRRLGEGVAVVVVVVVAVPPHLIRRRRVARAVVLDIRTSWAGLCYIPGQLQVHQ
jgi:hypothetical protein